MMKIVIADDQKSVRQSVRQWLENESDFKVIGEATDGIEAVEVISRQKPDILVTDLKMPLLDGIEVTKRVKELSPNTRVIILSMYDNEVYVDAAFKAGACGYILKKFGVDRLADAIRTVAGGRTYFRSSIR